MTWAPLAEAQTTLEVPGTYPTLQAAVTAANSGDTMLYALQPYTSGPPMGLNPFLPGSVMDPNLPGIALFGFGGGPLGPVVLPPGGMVVAFQVPPGLVGTTVRLQGYAVSPNAANGVWAGTNGIDLRIE